eukprot:12515673-Alexandrium_andersonii.AAC.1
MSASLVGSEMCIRDSVLAGRVRWPSSGASCGRGTLPAPARRQGGRQAVSYTHLTLPTICSV